MAVIYLKICQNLMHPLGTPQEESAHVYRQAGIFSSQGFHANTHFPQVRHLLSGKLQHKELHLSKPISLYGIRPDYLPREPARHRGLFACPETQGLPHGYSWQCVTRDFGVCERNPELAYLCRLGYVPDRNRQKTLSKGKISRRPERDRVCLRFNHHRPLSLPLPVGEIPATQWSHQTPHPPGSARQHPDVYPHIRRQVARRQYSRHIASGGSGVLRDGPGVRGF